MADVAIGEKILDLKPQINTKQTAQTSLITTHWLTSNSPLFKMVVNDRANDFLNLLLAGGFIFYARHAEATVGVDQPFLNFYDCTTQRNLSYIGKQQAIVYGQALRSLNIPIEDPVIASPFCRTTETATLAFEAESIAVIPFWAEVYRLAENLQPIEEDQILRSVTSALELPPLRGTNKMIISHSFPESLGLGRIPNMGTVIIKPYGRGLGYEVIGKLSLQDWQSLS
ncbi:MAG: histidine phosphatase family protein [Bacillaceae bacterium]|nr:histidine phosphatase family protein [Bacillaceae bacterium]